VHEVNDSDRNECNRQQDVPVEEVSSIPGTKVFVFEHLADISDGASPSEDGDHQDGGEPKGTAQPGTDDAKNSDPQIGDSDLELKWMIFGPSNVVGNAVAKEQMPDRSANQLQSAAVDQKISQHDRCPELGIDVLEQMRNGVDNRKDERNGDGVFGRLAFHPVDQASTLISHKPILHATAEARAEQASCRQQPNKQT
jgi:hypothetical protein